MPVSVPVASRYGDVLLPANDAFIRPVIEQTQMWSENICKMLASMVRPGATCIDVGAHVGFMSVAMSHLAGPGGKVISFEPNPATFGLLQLNTAALGQAQMQPVNAACWSYSGKAQMTLDPANENNTGDNRAFAMAGADERNLIDIDRVTIDEVLDGAPVHVMKVDAQGTESEVLRGAINTIATHKPLIVSEFWPQGLHDLGEDPLTALAFIRSLGYQPRPIDQVFIDGAITDEVIVDFAVRRDHIDLLLVPEL